MDPVRWHYMITLAVAAAFGLSVWAYAETGKPFIAGIVGFNAVVSVYMATRQP